MIEDEGERERERDGVNLNKVHQREKGKPRILVDVKSWMERGKD